VASCQVACLACCALLGVRQGLNWGVVMHANYLPQHAAGSVADAAATPQTTSAHVASRPLCALSECKINGRFRRMLLMVVPCEKCSLIVHCRGCIMGAQPSIHAASYATREGLIAGSPVSQQLLGVVQGGGRAS
jgi:hypothetical protein